MLERGIDVSHADVAKRSFVEADFLDICEYHIFECP